MELSKEQKQQLLIEIEAELCKRSLYEFFKLAVKVLEPSTQWQWNWHFEYVSDILQSELERIVRGEEKDRDYIINLPFRSGKSMLISVIYPAWCLLKDPTMPIMTISATSELAVKFSHKAKMLIESKWYQDRFGSIFKLREDSKAKGNFITDHGGSITAFGINSGIIGSGAALILMDDVQSPTDATPQGLKKTIETYQDVIYSRLNNPKVGLRIVLQQRVNLGDISGYLLRTSPDKFNNICIPAILTDDLFPKYLATKYTNKLFWEDRFSNKVLEDFRTTMRSTAYASQLLQRPTILEGDLIKRSWFKTIKQSEVLLIKNLQWNLILDTAFTTSTKNDPSALLLVAKSGNDLIIRKAWQRWLQFYELLEEIKEIQKVYNVNKIYVENKANGLSIIQELKRATKFNVLELSPNGKDKIERVTACQPSLESGRVILVEDEWNEMFLAEIAAFPNGRDDMVDTLTYSINQFLNSSGRTVFK